MIDFSRLFDCAFSRSGEWLFERSTLQEVFSALHTFLFGLGAALPDFTELSPGVWAHRRATISPRACLLPPCVIDEGTEIRHGAYLRGGVLIGKNCVVGNSTEIKNSILFDGAKAPHFNYVGESILGYRAHLGAGVILSNLRLDGRNVRVNGEDTGLKKLGSLLGDHAEIGCNSVLNPGTVIEKYGVVYPLSHVGGVLPENVVFKEGKIIKRGHHV